ncbi:MAG: DNA repair protein RadC [Candidatus Nanohaloarchaea archaeon]|nr:DNA repair protein RadC [Candidatus Nanohaloarchaea archaeon]
MQYRIQDLPASERPRERLQQEGVDALSDAELLAIVLRTGTQGQNVKQVCHELLNEMGLERMANATLAELQQFHGIGKVKAGQLVAALELCSRMDAGEADRIASFEEARACFVPQLRGLEQEELHAAFLGSSNRVKRVVPVFKGSLRSITVEPREVVRQALKHNASAVVVAHNHPDGDAEPTAADRETTRELAAALQEFDVRLLDHVIVGEDDCTSLKQDGVL